MKQRTQPHLYELLPELFTRSTLLALDFNNISQTLPDYQNSKIFFERLQRQGRDPRLPENRQQFNNQFLSKSGARYLIGQYAEDRRVMLKGSSIAKEGRTFHLGIDIFSKNVEQVFAPCDAEILAVGKEKGASSFGNYVLLKPDPSVTSHYIFLAHLGKDLPKLGKVSAGGSLVTLGDYRDGENGGWSRHLHVQLLKELPEKGSLPQGYSSHADLSKNKEKYPDPSFLVWNEV